MILCIFHSCSISQQAIRNSITKRRSTHHSHFCYLHSSVVNLLRRPTFRSIAKVITHKICTNDLLASITELFRIVLETSHQIFASQHVFYPSLNFEHHHYFQKHRLSIKILGLLPIISFPIFMYRYFTSSSSSWKPLQRPHL